MSFIPDKLVQALADALNGSDKAQDFIQRQGRSDLIMLHDAIRYEDESAIEALHENGYDDLGLFVIAVNGDPYAVQALFDGKQTRLAMCANAVIGDEKAIQWLQKNNMKAWIHLSEAVLKCVKDDE